MMVLVSYDVSTSSEGGQKRLRKVAKACQNYGLRVQNSVFECVLTESHFLKLRNEISNIIDINDDSICFYFLGNNWKRRVERIGKDTTYDIEGSLII